MVNDFLSLTTNLLEFFKSKIQDSLDQQSLEVSEEVEFYLAQLLTHYSSSKNLFSKTDEGKTEYRALALRLHDAVFDLPSKRFYHLKSLGDTALYHAGVFYDGLYNQIVNVDYYINMGGQAYFSLANLTTSTTQKTLADLFAELSEKFEKLVEILKLVCEAEVAVTDHDLLKLIERFQKTGSEKAKKILQERGIQPDLLLQQKIEQ